MSVVQSPPAPWFPLDAPWLVDANGTTGNQAIVALINAVLHFQAYFHVGAEPVPISDGVLWIDNNGVLHVRVAGAWQVVSSS